jgi:phosphinothricin acetyltransferase
MTVKEAEITIAPMDQQDWPSVLQIYEEVIATGDATFEDQAPNWNSRNESHLSTCRFVAIKDDQIVGWAALSPVSERCIYAGVAEVSVYVGAGSRGQGIGSKLLEALVQESTNQGIWTLQAGIFPENIASIQLHQNKGFRKVGIRENIGQLHDVWRDVVPMERRNPSI